MSVKSNVKYIMYGIVIIAVCIAIPVGCYQAKRAWNYNMGYESQVESSICKMVKKESLVDPDDC